MIVAPQPMWAALRPSELSTFEEEAPAVADEYYVVKKCQWANLCSQMVASPTMTWPRNFHVLRRH